MFSLERKNLPRFINRKIFTGFKFGLMTRNGTRPDADTVTKADVPQILYRAARRSLGSIILVVSAKYWGLKATCSGRSPFNMLFVSVQSVRHFL